MDKLKQLSVKLNGKIRSQNHFNINIEDTSSRRLIVKDYRQFKIKIDEYSDLYSIGINVNSDLSFAVNKPDKIFLYSTPKQLSNLPYKIYVSDETYNLIRNKYLEKFWNSFIILLNGIELSANESVFFYKNYIFIILNEQRDFVSILDNIIDLINANSNIFYRETKRNISTKKIPKNLISLIPYLKKYCVSDDADREQLAAVMDRKEKQKLINSVQPLFEEIRIYLDSFKNMPLSEEAVLIGELAELVSELKIKNI